VSDNGLGRYDVAFFEASVDSVEANRRLADMLGLPHPVLSDESRRVAAAYGLLNGGQTRRLRWTF
jgi:peroxiredoxin